MWLLQKVRLLLQTRLLRRFWGRLQEKPLLPHPPPYPPPPPAPTPPPIPPAATSAPVSSDVKVSPTKPVAPTPLSAPSIPAPTVRAQMSPPPAKGFDSIAEEVGLFLPTKGKSAPKTPPVSTPAPVLAKQALTPPMQKPVPSASP